MRSFSLPVSLSLSFTHKPAIGCLNVISGVLLVLVNPSCLPVDIYLRWLGLYLAFSRQPAKPCVKSRLSAASCSIGSLIRMFDIKKLSTFEENNVTGEISGLTRQVRDLTKTVAFPSQKPPECVPCLPLDQPHTDTLTHVAPLCLEEVTFLCNTWREISLFNTTVTGASPTYRSTSTLFNSQCNRE